MGMTSEGGVAAEWAGTPRCPTDLGELFAAVRVCVRWRRHSELSCWKVEGNLPIVLKHDLTWSSSR